jgi:hexosaminidase
VVTGVVRVEPGASLHATGTTVFGSLSGDGAARVELYGSAVAGPVSLRGGTTQVALIGDVVVGPMSLARNVTGPTPIVVAGNTVYELLRCVDNQPAPVNSGQPNTLYGAASGQCRDL